jgi:putative ABC transport system substrate-binding protein
MRRREFLGILGGVAVSPLAASAEQAGLPLIGVLGVESANPFTGAFPKGLAELGFFEGRNISVEYRWAENRIDRLPALAADLVRRQPVVIATLSGTASALAAKKSDRYDSDRFHHGRRSSQTWTRG